MIPLVVIMFDEIREHPAQVPLPNGITRLRHKFLIERTKRSAYAFGLGAWKGVWTTRMRDVSKSCRTDDVHFPSRSQIRTRWPIKHAVIGSGQGPAHLPPQVRFSSAIRTISRRISVSTP
jgi:hypothetical protein